MTDKKSSRLSDYYSELKKYIENQNYSKIIKTCNKIIAEVETEVIAWQCKLTALIHLGEFKEGLQSLKKCKVLEHLTFEKAYCEYRLNDTLAAWNTVSEAGSTSPRIKELEAQILYRLERYEQCYELYRELVKTTSDQFDQERLTNFTAVAVQRVSEGCKEQGPQLGSEATYEQLYNSGCELLTGGKIHEALKRLQEAEALCRSFLTQQEGATEEEVNEEVAIIRAQQGHCHQLFGHEKEALSIYNAVLKTKPDDLALLAVVNNNIVAINREGNVFDSKKRLKTTVAQGLEHKLTSRQNGAIALNHCLLAYHTNQDEICESEAVRIIKEFPDFALSAAVIQAANRGRTGKTSEVASCLKPFTIQNPDSAVKAILFATQILLAHQSFSEALDLLLSLEESQRFRSGLIAAMVVLCSATGKVTAASDILKDTIEWHKMHKSNHNQLHNLWCQAANFHLRNGELQTAVASLEELRKLNPTDVNTLAQLISAYSKFNTDMAQALSRELPDSIALVNDIDAEALEISFGSKYAKKMLGRDLGDGSPLSPQGNAGSPSEVVKKKKKKKKKKIRLPKTIVEGEDPDPERWLPRWQRKGYKKRRDRRNKDTMRGTQGVSSDAADKFDITKGGGGGAQQRHGHVHLPTPQSEGGYKRPQKKKAGKKKK